jgi:surface carbohydrate biosynthesis protein (TIGR04326 family)
MSSIVDTDMLLVWDSDKKLSSEHYDVAYWQSSVGTGTSSDVSIPEQVENNADQLKSQYLALIYELGEAKINGKRLVKLLEIRPGFSYWWMTLLAEKCNYAKSPQVDNVIKLMAFKEWFEKKSYKRISLVSKNAQLAEAMNLYADELAIGFEWKGIERQRSTRSLIKRIYYRLPNSIQAFVWLTRHLISHWQLKGVGVEKWRNTKAKTTFISYLFNSETNSLNRGDFNSSYWTALPHVLEEHQVETNWLHMYVKHDLLKDANSACSVIKKFNQSHFDTQTHVTLHTFLGFRLVLLVLGDWYKLFRLRQQFYQQIQVNSGHLWPLFKRDSQLSIIGKTGMNNLLHLRLFEEAMSDLPTQNKGCYLQENQGWEFSFIHSWQSSKHKNNLIGFPHTTVRYWDLRYFFDPLTYARKNNCDFPMPDYVGVNGVAAKKMYLDGGYPAECLIEVESLRYLQFSDVYNREIAKFVSDPVEGKVLVLGDYLKYNTVHQMELLSDADRFVNGSIQYIVKPHPACPICEDDYPELRLDISNDSIDTLIDQCSIVYTSNSTSAAVDAYCAGKPIVTVLDLRALNLSPFRGSNKVLFVSTPKELADVLNAIDKMNNLESNGEDFYYLDPELPRWTKCLVNSTFQQ